MESSFDPLYNTGMAGRGTNDGRDGLPSARSALGLFDGEVLVYSIGDEMLEAVGRECRRVPNLSSPG